MIPPRNRWAMAIALVSMATSARSETNLPLLALAAPPADPFALVTNKFSGPTHGNSISAAWGDLNGDGRLDLGVANLWPSNVFYRGFTNGMLIPTAFFHPQGLPGPFSQATAAIAFGDLDNDGDLDAFAGGPADDRVFLNEGNYFTPIFRQSGVTATHSANLVDIDNDGWLDVFTSTGGGMGAYPEMVYYNHGGTNFTVGIASPISTTPSASYGASWADYDNDGRLDVILPNNSFTGRNFLFHNEGGGQFTQVLDGPVATDLPESDGSAWGDLDNDGDFDLFISNGANLDNFLYLNDGAGHFTKVTDGSVVHDQGFSVGAVFGDYDNDGWLDLLVANRLGPCFLYHNRGDGTLERVTAGELASTYTDGNAVSLVDEDNDGFLDAFVANWAGEGGPDDELFFRNTGNTHAWIKVRLAGTASNRSGIGAQIRVVATLQGTERTQLRQIGGFDSAGSTALEAHFGLADATEVRELRVRWPSGIQQVLTNLAVRQTLVVEEPPVTAVTLSIEPPAGIFTNAVEVAIRGGEQVQVRYTLDGTEPTSASPLYARPLRLRATTTVQARGFVRGQAVGNLVSAPYRRIYAYEGDGLTTDWRETYFGPGFDPFDPRVDAAADSDGDGATNQQEFWARTNPVDAQSVLRIGIRAVPQILWTGTADVTYQVRRHSIQTPGQSFPIGNPVRGTGTVIRVVDELAPDPYSFYSVEIVPSAP